MEDKIYVSDDLKPFSSFFEQVIKKTIQEARKFIPIKGITIEVVKADNVDILKDINGIGAYCPSGNFVQLSIDIDHPAIQTDLVLSVKKSLLHELHHVSRRQSGIDMEKEIFLECFLTEGLADYFVYEITKEFPIWTNKLTPDDEKRLMVEVEYILDKQFDIEEYKRWFIEGDRKYNIPRFAGYTIGRNLVETFLKNNPEKTVFNLVSVPVCQLDFSVPRRNK